MISENIAKLRKQNKLSQEELAEKINVTRQTISKWEAGESIPDVIHCNNLAKVFDVSLDDLVNSDWDKGEIRGLPPKGKYIFGTVTIGEKGQIVIPAKARRIFGLSPGTDLMMLGDINQGLALIQTKYFIEFFEALQNEEHREKS